MSNYIVKIIPKNEKIIPDDNERAMIINQLKIIISDKELRDYLFDEVKFVDSGSNFEGIICNHCLQAIETEWWAEQMDKASSNHFNELSIITLCCTTTSSLNKLHYIWPMGFARYIIEIINPVENEVIEIEKLITNKNYNLIRAHY